MFAHYFLPLMNAELRMPLNNDMRMKLMHATKFSLYACTLRLRNKRKLCLTLKCIHIYACGLLLQL